MYHTFFVIYWFTILQTYTEMQRPHQKNPVFTLLFHFPQVRKVGKLGFDKSTLLWKR